MTTTNNDQTFADWLAGFGSGALNDKLTAGLRDVASQVALLEKSGSVTLKITMSPQGGGVIVQPKVTVTAPEAKEGGQFFFVTGEGLLSRRDPNQPTLPTYEDL